MEDGKGEVASNRAPNPHPPPEEIPRPCSWKPSEGRGFRITYPDGATGNETVVGAYLIDSFDQARDSNGKPVNYLGSFLRRQWLETDEVWIAIHKGGAALTSTEASYRLMLDQLFCRVKYLVPIISGNDLYRSGKIVYPASLDDAARSFCSAARLKADVCYCVVAMSHCIVAYCIVIEWLY